MSDVSGRDGDGAVAWGDLAFALAVIVAAAVVWVGTADLPPPRYEPVGSAALPRGIAAIMACLALVVAFRARGRGTSSDEPGSPADALRAVLLGALVVGFVAIMDARLLGFRPAAAIFVLAACVILGGVAPRRLAAYAAFAIVLSLGLHAVFTQLFYVDLP